MKKSDYGLLGVVIGIVSIITGLYAYEIRGKLDKIIKLDSTRPSLSQDINPYGKGYGKITIYTTCKDCGNTDVWIDGKKVGILDFYFTNGAFCGEDGTVSQRLKVGKHKIFMRDTDSTEWEQEVYIQEGICTVQGFRDDKK